ncbi:helix-turn-helix domain-containing protein [Pseudomonas sp. FSL R10-2964]|jgi:transcriptional regulator with XRE-family HTH domain|uniref:XRE family transcriptional regulator n=1 Tax=Pseudomonas sp. FSL R10-2964 TaxID=2662202 RepID=UPI001296041B|nr:LexA family transcriptional regulator [Pseudomonas sp. FSL R10-2964]MQT83956.1 helix-turn-helix domain-containing protein [Pseudomonas sp. FSL R10-2964]
MNESLAQRIKRLRKEAGLSQAQLADACGWKSQSRVGNYEAGTREPNLADISAIAKALRIDDAQLLLSTPPADLSPLSFETAQTSVAPGSAADAVRAMLAKSGKNVPEALKQKIIAVADTADSNVVTVEFSRPGLVGDEVWIAHYDIRGAMGAGQSIHDFPEMLKDIRVSPSHLRELGVEFEEHYHLKLVTGWGQSMEPTIKHRDPLIVNVHVREFSGDGIYLFFWDDHVYIKRLQVADEDHFEMISDNTRHKDRLIRRDMTYIQARVLLVWNAHLL